MKRKWKKKKICTMLLCGALLLGGCGRKAQEEESPENLRGVETEQILEEEIAKEHAVQEEAFGGEQEAEGQEDSSADLSALLKDADGDRVTLEMGPDKEIWREGSLVCTLSDFRLYDSFQDAAIGENEVILEDARSYMDQSIFLLMQAEIRNLDDSGDIEDGTINISMFTIEPKEQTGNDSWYNSYPVYLSEPGTGVSDYYHLSVAKGETKTVSIGFYVPVKDAEELREECMIVIDGCHEEGYMYGIPALQ